MSMGEEAVVVFTDPKRADALVREAPAPPEGGWHFLPMNESELLAWLREQKAQGTEWLMLDPGVLPHDPSRMNGHMINFVKLLDRGRALEFFRDLADFREAELRDS
jgi:hypothetical protein